MGKLIDTTVAALLDDGRLPSGLKFELMPDTVAVALHVAEANDQHMWREKLLQVLAVTKTVAGMDVREKGGVDFLSGLLDTDVLFLALAWTAEMNSRRLKLNEPLPCPSCSAPFSEIALGPIGLTARAEPPPATAPQGWYDVEGVDTDSLPAPFHGMKLVVTDPTWTAARSGIPENSWDKSEAVRIYRSMSTLYVQDRDGKRPPRKVVRAEFSQIPMRALQAVFACMNDNIPSIANSMTITCKECGAQAGVPFDQVS